MPVKPPVPESPQKQDPPGKPADPYGIDLTNDDEPGAEPTQPHLPHERDQRANMTDGNPDAQVQQAWEDVERGLQDTDRGPPSDDAYRKLKKE